MNRVRELRISQNLSQTQLAKRLHLSQGTLSLYERGLVEPDMATLQKLADIFDCSVDYIIGRTDIRKATAFYTSSGIVTPIYGVSTRSIPVLGNVALGGIEMKNRIKEIRQSRGESQKELASALGIAQSTLSYWENGSHEPDFTSLHKIANRYGCSIDYILCRTDIWDDSTGKISALGVVTPLYGVGTRMIPVLGNIACGEPKLAREEHEAMVAVGAEVSADFCLRAKGDSMIGDRIHDGDMVFARSQPEVENGEIAVVVIGDEATLKHVFYYEDRKMLVLRPSNPSYEDITYIGDELAAVTILGKAVAFQSLL